MLHRSCFLYIRMIEIGFNIESRIGSITTMTSISIVSQLVLGVLIGVTSINGKPPSAIVGGEIADDNEFPYQVSLRVYGQHICGGSIIDSTHILTAAHCIDDSSLISQLTVVTSTNEVGWNGGGKRYGVKRLTIHPRYDPDNTWRNDIGIITLSSAIKFDDRQKPIELPTSDILVRSSGIASGWGDLYYPNGASPTKLRKLKMNVIPKGSCVLPGNSVFHGQLCAIDKYGSGLCSGDSGGPLAVNGVIVGLASFVYPCGVGQPDVFTRVFTYVDWIKEVSADS